ncbi:RluA family pseudouridine synthase [Eubacterium xylanophilum]|uniref:RluA family pseudouridine synthase n=1 Tax=Eubacterium xylanophilum TaxID=39497 RepID=UPI0004B070BB|nr:RluA family pseudouridine synthase [Eubacterium xylanophilum]
MPEVKSFRTELDEEMRIDQLLTERFNDFSRSYVQKLIKEGNVKANGIIVSKTGFKVKDGTDIEVTVPEPVELDIKPENIPLDIIFEDDDVLIVNKPKDMVVHPANGHYSGTLVNALMYHCKDNLSAINGVLRPGIVHRIDKDTTGALIVCKNDKAHRFIADQLREHSITRTYEAIVLNNFKEDEGTIDKPLGRSPLNRKKRAVVPDGRPAITHYRVISHLNQRYNHIELNLETGRTHQIRVHMKSINHPLLGDTLYGIVDKQFKNLQGQTLHAKNIGFIHPTSKEYVEFEAKRPEYFDNLLRILSDNS